jgi:hypothetical protein
VPLQKAWLHCVLLENAFVLTQNCQQYSQWVQLDIFMCEAKWKQTFPEGTDLWWTDSQTGAQSPPHWCPSPRSQEMHRRRGNPTCFYLEHPMSDNTSERIWSHGSSLLGSGLVYFGCYNKNAIAWVVYKQQKFISHIFRSWEVQNQNASRFVVWWESAS